MAKKKRNARKKRKQKPGAFLAGILVIVFVGLGIRYWNHTSEKEVAEVSEAKTEVTEATSEATTQVYEAPSQPVKEEQNVIDFAPLKERNEDIYAWITVPGTNIDYPVLQAVDDNEYYLHHNVDNEEDIYGSIYTENYNSKDFDDSNTIVYGHNMRNGSMFRTLHNFEDKKFFKEHKEITIYTEDSIYRYRIFAAYVGSNAHLLFAYDFNNRKQYASFLKSVYENENANIDQSVTVTAANKIITLSTCNNGVESERYFVLGVLQQ